MAVLVNGPVPIYTLPGTLPFFVEEKDDEVLAQLREINERLRRFEETTSDQR